MKVLSIQQPWASLIILRHKKIETRSFDTKIRGEILIHASMGKLYKKIPPEDSFWKHYHQLFAKNQIEPIEKLPFGAIIGKVELIDVVPTDTLVGRNQSSHLPRPSIYIPSILKEWFVDEKEAQKWGKFGGHTYFPDVTIEQLRNIAQNNLFKDVDLSELTPAFNCACTT